MIRIAINGFGRIGRAAAKIIFERDDVELVAVNDLGDVETMAHLLKYDSVYRVWQHEVGFDEGDIIVDRHRIHCYCEKDPSKLPWRELKVDVVIESTGYFLTKADCEAHLAAGAKKVVISAPPKDDEVKMFVMGVNDREYKGEKIISNASCTTNCITPVMKILNDAWGVEKSLMTTVHSYTGDQNLVDGPHKDLRRARSAALNIVPTSTGAAKAAYKTIPDLKGKFDGLAIRVPTPVVSLADMTVLLKKKVTIDELTETFTKYSQDEMKGILAVSDEEIVSSDLIGSTYSSIVDLPLIQIVDGDLVKIIAWYDNEWGYSERLIDMATLAATWQH
ncbi:MAG: type I glyceraldehyde-3-phosphate dehydrogenase [Candidatus Berkelbacteria bacterium]